MPPAPRIAPARPPFFDYSTNLRSEVFGAQLFTGTFARQGATQFNPDYAVAIGDRVQVRMWGAFEYSATLDVDPKGNIFLPNIGPVRLLGVRNQDLQRMVQAAISSTSKNRCSPLVPQMAQTSVGSAWKMHRAALMQ